MIQLTENKPQRRALIATLSHFSPSCNASCTRFRAVNCKCACGSVEGNVRVPNRNIRRLEPHLTRAKSTRESFLIATNDDIVKSRHPAKSGPPKSPASRAPRSPARRAWEISRAWGISPTRAEGSVSPLRPNRRAGRGWTGWQKDFRGRLRWCARCPLRCARRRRRAPRTATAGTKCRAAASR